MLDRGRIVETGTHGELLAVPGGLYAQHYEELLGLREEGCCHLLAHIETVKKSGGRPVVCINGFYTDTPAEIRDELLARFRGDLSDGLFEQIVELVQLFRLSLLALDRQTALFGRNHGWQSEPEPTSS